MLLWIVFAVLTAGVVAALVRPWREASEVPADPLDSPVADLAIYRDQLAEIDLDRERGAIEAAEADAARAEVARRILARNAERPGQAAASTGSVAGRWAVPLLAGGVPAAAVMLYLATGAPDLPGQPLASRTAAPGSMASVEQMLATVESRLDSNPEDGRGWDVVAPIYKGMRRYADAAAAYANANRILGETPKRLAGFVESEILANNGIVTAMARNAAERLLAAEPGRPDASLWLALAKEQDGDLAGALAAYRAILAQGIPQGNLRTAIESRISSVENQSAGTPSASAPGAAVTGPTSGSTAATPEAIAALPPAEQAKMIEGMVARLAARLETEPGDIEGWLRLLNAYSVMGRKDAALAALGKARAGLANDAAALARIGEAARTLGLETVPSAATSGP